MRRHSPPASAREHAPSFRPAARRFPGRLLAGLLLLLGAGSLTACSATTPTAINPPAKPRAADAALPDDSAAIEALTRADADAWLDGLVPSALEREGIAGAAVAIVHDGEIVTQRGFGYARTGAPGTAGDDSQHETTADAGAGEETHADDDGSTATAAGEPGEPSSVDPERTLFRLGSISKSLTATAVLRLQEEGLLEIDSPITEYLDFELPTEFDTPVTLRHLLSHTAGFEDRLADVQSPPGSETPTLREAVAQGVPRQIFEPGTTPAYSNYGNGLAAYIVERVSGEPFESFVQREVFDRAGMSSATLAQPPHGPLADDLAHGYRDLRSAEVPFETVSPAPAGAASATAADMSAFMLAQLNYSGDEGPRLLEPESLELMQQPAFGAESLGGLAAGDRTALGLYEQNRNGHRVLSHGGDLIAFHAEMQLYPEQGTGIFVAVNSLGTDQASSVVLRSLLTTGFADRYVPDERPEPQPLDTAAEHAAVVAGTYTSSRRYESTFMRLYSGFTRISVTAHDGGLLTVSGLTDASGEPLVLTEVEPWVWQEIGGQHRLAADVADGQVRALGLHPAIVLEPMPVSWALLPATVAIAVLILLLTLLCWPLAALVRHYYAAPLPLATADRRLRLATLLASAAALLGLAVWVSIAVQLFSGWNAAAWAIRIAQAFTLIGVLGLLPAGWRFWRAVRDPGAVRRRGHRFRVLTGAVVVLGFAALAYSAVIGGLLIPDVSY